MLVGVNLVVKILVVRGMVEDHLLVDDTVV